jgi:hypothetical protein
MAKIQVLPEVGGWRAVVDTFESVHIAGMDRYVERFVILNEIQKRIPDRLSTRVFTLGVLTEPERLKSTGMGSYEAIGRTMAKDCRDETTIIWEHELFRHNASEIRRLREQVRPILY